MSLLVAAGFVLAGVVIAALVIFWKDVRNWLNNVAVNHVEKLLGYKARKGLQKAVCAASKAMEKIRNTAKIFYKRDVLDNRIDVLNMEFSANESEFDEKTRKKFDEIGQAEQLFEYKG